MDHSKLPFTAYVDLKSGDGESVDFPTKEQALIAFDAYTKRADAMRAWVKQFDAKGMPVGKPLATYQR